MNTEINWSELIPIIAPLFAVQFVLVLIALIMCIKAEETRGPKLMWVFIIVFVNILGPIAFFIAGRRNDR